MQPKTNTFIANDCRRQVKITAGDEVQRQSYSALRDHGNLTEVIFQEKQIMTGCVSYPQGKRKLRM